MAQLMFKIANEPHADILNYIPDLAPGLVAIIDRSLAKNPDDRFQTGEELARAIKACMAGGGDTAAQSDIVDIGL
jgi:serine/threonine-protein kinase